LIVEILKLEILRQLGDSIDLALKKRIENTFLPSRMISRDDKQKYQEKSNSTKNDAEFE